MNLLLEVMLDTEHIWKPVLEKILILSNTWIIEKALKSFQPPPTIFVSLSTSNGDLAVTIVALNNTSSNLFILKLEIIEKPFRKTFA